MATFTLIDGQGRAAAVGPSDRIVKTQEAATALAELELLLSADDPLKPACAALSNRLKARRFQKGGK
ncbi:MAG: hypothetical protein M3065_21760 [Actinomycetota bacterium]|nr:hypothetical protein [Actinomycetota bacterium]